MTQRHASVNLVYDRKARRYAEDNRTVRSRKIEAAATNNKRRARLNISTDRAKFGVPPRGTGAEIQNSASCRFCLRMVKYTCQVSSTSAQRSRSVRV